MSYASPSTGLHTAYTPTQYYPPHHDTDILAPYPLSLHPRATIEVHRTRSPQPLEAPCRQCTKPTPISLTQQKLFLTIERLLQTHATNVLDEQRNKENHWVVNYGIGLSSLFVESDGRIEAKGRAWPFVDELELDVTMKLLQMVGEGLNERSLDMYLLMLKSMDGVSKGVIPTVQPVGFGAPRKPKSYRSGKYVPSTPPESSQLRPPVPSIIASDPPLLSFNTMKDLFKILDRTERDSYAGARIVEAYADVVVNEACTDCWVGHNAIDIGKGVEDNIGLVGQAPFLGMDVQACLVDKQKNIVFGRTVWDFGDALPTLQAPRVPLSEVWGSFLAVNRAKRAREEELESWRERAKRRGAARGGTQCFRETERRKGQSTDRNKDWRI